VPQAAESAIYIGCMSGTSLDGVDCAAVRFDDRGPVVEQLAWDHRPYPSSLIETLRRAALGPVDIDALCRLDIQLGRFYAETLAAFMADAGLPRTAIGAIGLHGQTLRHAPDDPLPYSLQIGDAATVAAACNLTVVADFRRRDIALGGQGAPLTPAFHAYALRREGEQRAVLNIGGISNLTLLPGQPDRPVTGFDCGPGNCLIDYLARRDFGQPYDPQGRFAARGRVDTSWLQQLLDGEPYFHRPPPKSTGTDHFSPQWLAARDPGGLNAEDRMATITELTAVSIAEALRSSEGDKSADRLLVCGGGARNRQLMKRLQHHLPGVKVTDTSSEGLDPQRVEAIAFAWLARQTLLGRPGNLPSVTHARSATVLGSVHPRT